MNTRYGIAVSVVGIMILMLCLCAPAFAALSELGPNDPVHGFPSWVMDPNGVAVGLATDPALSIFDAPIPGNVFSQLIGFGTENFFWYGFSTMPVRGGGAADLTLGVEAAFSGGDAAPNDQFLFGRIRIRIDTPVAGNYRVIHPYGVEVFTDAPAGIKGINSTIDFGSTGPNFITVLGTRVGPFLVAVNPAPPAGWLGDPAILQTVTGSTFGTNYFRIEGPVGSNLDGLGHDFIQSNQFNISGKIVVPTTPVSATRVDYERNAIGQVQVFANSKATGTLTMTAPTNPTPAPMAGDGAGNFFALIPLADPNVVPATVTITADNGPNWQPTTITANVVDFVNVTLAAYNPATQTLTVEAVSGDQIALPVLTSTGYGALTNGRLVTTVAVPPASVTVTSAKGGSDTRTVAFPLNLPPVAVDDTASAATAVPTVISVLANDTDPDSAINPASVQVVLAPLNGTAVPNADGTVTYTSATSFEGLDVFTYTVSDTAGAVSNVATVTVNVTLVAPATAPGAPTGVSAVAGIRQATVSFTGPASDGGRAIIFYTATSTPGGFTATGAASPLTVTGLANNTAYTFTVTATNAVGTGPASAASASVTTLNVPGAPTAVSAVAGIRQAVVSFTSPAFDGGSPIISFTATSVPGGFTASGLAPLTVTGLANNTAYTFTVTATNAVGTGPASTASTSVTTLNVPGAPTAASAVAGVQQATVSFTAPASNGGSAITSYTATSAPGGFTATGVSSPLTVTGLADGTAYTFTVTATNAVGTGPASTPSTSVTTPFVAVVPGAPTAVNAVAGIRQAVVSFTSPAFDGGSPIISYTATSVPGGFTATGLAPLTVTGLANNTTYTFTVTATNAVGTGPASTPSTGVTTLNVPGAPTAASAVAGIRQATVSFTAPASNGGNAIASYTATSAPGGFTATGASSPLTVTGLADGTAYTFTVTATNAVGTGPASTASTGVTTLNIPGAPAAASAVAGVQQATVSFTAPASNGGSAITSYTATSAPGGFTATGASSPLTVTGLADGTAYTFTVTATNAVGTGPASTPSTGVTTLNVPGAPGIGTATVGAAAGSATVTFTPPASNGGSAITSYLVTSTPGNFTATGPASPLTITGLAPSTTYTFTVRAVNAVGTGTASAVSNAVTIPLVAPAAPTGLTAVSSALSKNPPTVSLSWTNNSPNQATFAIQRATDSAFTRGVANFTVALNITSLTDTTVAPLTSYFYRVRAVNAAGNSAWSNTAAVTTVGQLAAVPSAPTLAVLSIARTSITLGWTPQSNNQTAYTLQRQGPSGAWVTIATVASTVTARVDSGLTPNTTYSYRIAAINANGTSEWSTVLTVKTLP